MRDILTDLNAVPSVRGSAIVMGDGVVIAAQLSSGSDADSYAALASSLLSQIRRNLPKLDLGRMQRAMVTATRGRFSFNDVGGAWLIVELERDIDASQVELEIESAAGRLRKRLRMRMEAQAPAALPAADSERNRIGTTQQIQHE